MYLDLILESLKLIIVVSCVPLVCVAFIGTVFAFVQSSLQIQEQSLSHIVRLSVFGLCAFLFLSFCCDMFIRFTEETFLLLPLIGRRG